MKDAYKEAQNYYLTCKKQLEALKIEKGQPESSIMAEVELTLKKLIISSIAYHGGDFNGVCCQRLVKNAQEITM